MTEKAVTHPTPPARGRRIRRSAGIAALAIGVLLLLALGGAVLWANDAAQPMPEALAALQSDAQVTVSGPGTEVASRHDWIEFTPTSSTPTTGLIFYGGGRVDARAYAPPLRALAEQGYLVANTPMPFNLAILSPQRADAVIAAHPEIKRWLIAGHSLGGATAAIYVNRRPQAVQGVVFWAAYPPDSDSLAPRTDLAVTSIYGTLDGLATPDKIAATAALLPPAARMIPIEGGNHAQFGWYGEQAGDNPATISRQEQQAQIVAATAAALAGE